MAKILVVFGSTHGQTEKIARVLEEELRNLGNTVEVANAATIPKELRLDDYEGVVIGAPVYYSGYPKPVKAWTKAHASHLSKIPTAFFSVCLGVLQKGDEKAQNDEQRIVREFLAWSGLRPRASIILGGALSYSKYGLLTKLIMRSISRRSGRDTDTSRDYEYTDWEEVRRFARTFDQIVRETGRPPGGKLKKVG